MGGSGSGSWYRWSSKDKVEDYRRLSIKRLCEENVIKSGSWESGSWQWLADGEVTSSIGYEANTLEENTYFRVHYTNTRTEEKFDYKIRLATTNPNYGGKRWWFICPLQGCGRRVANLYSAGRYYGCRHCYNLTYQSQSDAPHYRALHKAQKIHQELGGDGCIDDWLEKPKHMHWKTFNRKVDEMIYLDDLAMMEATKRFGLVEL